jgi:hypothetical protein
MDAAGHITVMEREDRLTLRQRARLVRIAADTSNYGVRQHALRLLDEAAQPVPTIKAVD